MDWEQKLMAAMAAGTLGSDEVAYVRIEHKDKCGIFRNRGCTCDPAVKFARGGKMITIGEDGKAVN